MQKPADHPIIPPRKVGILIANLGTPDGYDYWPMRRYLNEFLSDRRVIDYPAWKWQPILQGIILTKRPRSSGAAYKSIWNHEQGESPLMTITKAQTAKLKSTMQDLYGDQVMVDFCMRYGNPSTSRKWLKWSNPAVIGSCSFRYTRNMRARRWARRMTNSSGRLWWKNPNPPHAPSRPISKITLTWMRWPGRSRGPMRQWKRGLTR